MQPSPAALPTRLLLVGLLALLLPSADAQAAHEAPGHTSPDLDYLRLTENAWAALHLPRAAAGPDAPPVIILLGDSGGQDGRPALYTMRLVSVGLAVLDADFSDTAVSDGGVPDEHRVPHARRLSLSLAALRNATQVAGARVAAVGIGEGARAVIAAPPDAQAALTATVLIYPGCDAALHAAAWGLGRALGSGAPPMLLAYGDLDREEAEACSGLVAALGGAEAGTSELVVRGAAFGWAAAAARQGRVVLQDPADPDRHREASPDPDRALIALDRMLAFLLASLAEPPRQ